MEEKIQLTTIYKKMAGRTKKYKNEAEARAAKLASNRISKQKQSKTQDLLTNKQKLFAKFMPISASASEAARKAGYSESSVGVSAFENLRKPEIIKQIEKEEKNLRQAFKDRGLDEDYLADRFKDVIDYNSKKIKKFYGEGDNLREVEEMRDAKVVAKALVDVAKLAGSSLENVSNNATVNVDSSTAWLAIKSLVKKLEKEQIRLLRDSCDALLCDDCEVVS